MESISSFEFETVDGVSLRIDTRSMNPPGYYGCQISYASPAMELKAESFHSRRDWWQDYRRIIMNRWNPLERLSITFSDFLANGTAVLSVPVEYIPKFKDELLQPLDQFSDVLSVRTIKQRFMNRQGVMYLADTLKKENPWLDAFLYHKRYCVLLDSTDLYSTDYVKIAIKGWQFLRHLEKRAGCSDLVSTGDKINFRIRSDLLDYLKTKVENYCAYTA